MNPSVDMFNFVAFAPSLMIGLGISRLMGDAVTLFRSRSKARIDWIPIVWAICIFLIEIQFSWGLIELHGVRRPWTILSFLLLLGISLCLYLAAALVLPDLELAAGTTLEKQFNEHGRWSLLALFFAEVFAVLVDFTLFRKDLSATVIAGLLATTLTPLIFLFCRGRRAEAAVTVAYLAITLMNCWSMSPKSY